MHALMTAFSYSIFLFAIGLILFFLYAVVYNMKLYFYLKKEKYDRWSDLTTLGSFGPGGSNPIRWMPYLKSDLDNDDENIRRYKNNVRLGLRQSLFIFIALLVNATILAVLIVMSKT